MKFKWSDLESAKNPYFNIDGEIEIVDKGPDDYGRFLELQDIYVEGNGYYNADTTEFIVGLEINSHVVVPCAITLKPVEIEVNTTLSETFVFEPDAKILEDENIIVLEEDEVDLLPYIRLATELAIPLKVIDPELTEYPKGEGWAVLTEADLEEQRKEQLDPRLAKLKQFKFEE